MITHEKSDQSYGTDHSAYVCNNKFKKKSKQNDKDFTRERKVGFVSMPILLLRMVSKSTQLELDEFRERALSLSADSDTNTKQSFSEARQKLRPIALTLLNDKLIHGFYEDDDFKTFNNFWLLAKRTPRRNVPTTSESKSRYPEGKQKDANTANSNYSTVLYRGS